MRAEVAARNLGKGLTGSNVEVWRPFGGVKRADGLESSHNRESLAYWRGQKEWSLCIAHVLAEEVLEVRSRQRVHQVTSNGSIGRDLPAETQPQNPPQPAPNAWQVIKGVLFRIFIIWAISSWFRRGQAPQDQVGPGGAPRVASRNLFPKDTLMNLHVYISEHEHFTDFNATSALFWEQHDLVYGDWTSGENSDGCYEHFAELDIPQSVQQNGSIYIHVYFTKSGFHPDPRQKALYRRLATVHMSRMINKYKRRRFQKTKNLLTGETEADPEMIKRAEDYGPVEVISHWHPNITINIVDDHTPWVKGSVPPPLDQYVKFDAVSGDYYPIIYFNDYWNLQKDYYPINESLASLPLRVSFCPLSLWRWQLYAAQSTKSPWNFLGDELYEQSDEEQDSVKVALLETNPYLLALTIIVSIVHSVFEFLAFKNDIQFWNSRQSLEGLSVRSVFFGVFQSFVVLLYILDNETNFVVQVSVFIGVLIDLWKITKVMDVRLDREHKVAGLFPRPTFKDKSTYIESSTKVYDDMAFRYLSWILFPLLGCYAVYSLLYLEHKGSLEGKPGRVWGQGGFLEDAPSSAHGCPLTTTIGFITMTPQLFINYKLKSVAHLPWRMLTYKALNTFIDDLFAFVIKMPVMYRIGCLRDDVVFFIYLYQRWIYRVDPTRVNEFGMSGEAPTATAPTAEAPTATGALSSPPTPDPATITTAAGEEASTPMPAKPTQGASSTTEPQEVPLKPAEDKKRD
ncbi:PREDICTED: cleft lip and palate transmembrane protein 1 [Myotis davidii]|uniref:cleft lip and palate transmembrane protein 1 n=1 Tax=Myotis davidii TaxID=225400 RepID=UPI000766EE4A|nr:PREDICTED: cleft lip and palate transmembrane protein 1 [Myotis davidii]